MAEKVLKNLDSLSTKVETEVEPQRLSLANLYLKAFRQFYSVVKACFGQELALGYHVLIKNFMITYWSLNISIPLKVKY